MSSFLVVCNFKILMVLVLFLHACNYFSLNSDLFLSNGFGLIFTKVLSVSFVDLVIYY